MWWTPPLVDVSNPRNAEAFRNLRVAISGLGHRYCLRLQLWASVCIVSVVLMDVLAFVVVLTSRSGRPVFAAVESVTVVIWCGVHMALIGGLVLLMILFGAIANVNHERQCDTLHRVEVNMRLVRIAELVLLRWCVLGSSSGADEPLTRPRAACLSGAPAHGATRLPAGGGGRHPRHPRQHAGEV
jgi:hypothetical protein